jgi:signal transduction histidine kinase
VLPRQLRGLRVQLLLWTVLPLTLLLGTLAIVGITSHRRAMADMVRRVDARLALQGAHVLDHELADRVNALQAADQASLANLSDHPFDGGVARYGQDGALLQAFPSVTVWKERPYATLAPKDGFKLSPFFLDRPTGRTMMLLGAGHGEQTVVGAVSLEGLRMTDLFAHNSGDPDLVSYLADGTGRVLFNSNSASIGQDFSPQPGVAAALRGESGATSFIDEHGEEWAVGYAPVGDFGLGLVVQEPWSRLEPPLMNLTLFTPLLAVVAAVVAAAAVTLGLRYVVRPLQALDRQASQLAWGDLSAINRPVGGVQEIEDLRLTLAHMADQVGRYQEGMRDYIGAITAAQEEERKRLARDLHDETVQSLIAIGHQIERVQKTLAKDPAAAAQRLDEMRRLVADTQQEVRRFSQALRPLYLEDLGFLPALEALVDEVNRAGQRRATLRVKGDSRRLSPALELAAYRISQEAVQNVIRHAGATELTLTVSFTPDALTLHIADNGIGFEPPANPSELAHAGHFGLMGIRERALLFGGKLEIDGKAGSGTTLTVSLPDKPQ